MRRTKHGPALFELLGDGEFRNRSSGQGVDDGPHEDASDAVSTDEQIEGTCSTKDREEPIERFDSAAEQDGIRAGSSSYRASREARPSGPTRITPPVVEFDGERLRLSLTSVGAAVVFFVAILVVVGGFLFGQQRGKRAGIIAGYEAGRASYAAATTDEIEAARRQAPATYLIGGLLDDRAGSAPNVTPTQSTAGRQQNPAEQRQARSRFSGRQGEAGSEYSEWIDGFTYIVVQEFSSGSRDDAVAAQAFLEQYGVATEVVGLSDGRSMLMTRQGFNRKDPTQRKLSDQLLEKVRAIGAQYFASGGRYKLEGYLKTHKGDG